jgi:hypothetical protein
MKMVFMNGYCLLFIHKHRFFTAETPRAQRNSLTKTIKFPHLALLR